MDMSAIVRKEMLPVQAPQHTEKQTQRQKNAGMLTLRVNTGELKVHEPFAVDQRYTCS